MKNGRRGEQDASQDYSEEQFIDSAEFIEGMTNLSLEPERPDDDQIIGKKDQDFSALETDFLLVEPVDRPEGH